MHLHHSSYSTLHHSKLLKTSTLRSLQSNELGRLAMWFALNAVGLLSDTISN